MNNIYLCTEHAQNFLFFVLDVTMNVQEQFLITVPEITYVC